MDQLCNTPPRDDGQGRWSKSWIYPQSKSGAALVCRFERVIRFPAGAEVFAGSPPKPAPVEVLRPGVPQYDTVPPPVAGTVPLQGNVDDVRQREVTPPPAPYPYPEAVPVPGGTTGRTLVTGTATRAYGLGGSNGAWRVHFVVHPGQPHLRPGSYYTMPNGNRSANANARWLQVRVDSVAPVGADGVMRGANATLVGHGPTQADAGAVRQNIALPLRAEPPQH